MSEFANEITSKTILLLPKLAVSVVIFLAFYALAWILKRIVIRIGHLADNDRIKILELAGSILKITTIIIGLITALGTLGVDVTALVAGLGLTGFALGFALKDALSNLLAGILLLFYHPFRCGNRIKVSGCEGVVTDINLRYTKLDNGDTEFLIPNSTCFTNWIAIRKESANDD